ncbi:MAG: flagellar biosynthesis protein FlhA, partial [Gammaproteobacteria bacterium]|nr:flagellar biosynthesis protein FlhA [Gammaproteobacteria bacterium]
PISPRMLDFFLVANISLALLILLLTFYVDKPLKFSTFPSLLLLATLFRLALNIAATRLILGSADAGRLISAIGEHVVGGNYVIGLIVFLVLVVVQYVVVTNGAQRVAEVAARFTLDAMPGKQMSIDADLNIGLIDETQARARRREVEQEANFYGAMDGASKFVKGDAIAGIVILLIDIIGGLTIGVFQHHMNWDSAVHTYTLLTIGDGIVTQVPALIIATGTGIIVTRAASDEFLSKEITKQITAYPKALLLLGSALFVLLFLPGVPALPVAAILLVVGLIYWRALVNEKNASLDPATRSTEDKKPDDYYNLLRVEPVEINLGSNLVAFVGGESGLFMERTDAFRKQLALDLGVVVPRVRVKDNKKTAAQKYEVHIYGAKVAEGELYPEMALAIDPGTVTEKVEGNETRDPSYGLPALWIPKERREQARKAGYTLVDAATVLMTHLNEVMRQQLPNVLTRSETQALVEKVREEDAGLLEELIPGVMTLSDIQKVLQRLLKEKVSIRGLRAILEVLVDYGKTVKDTDVLTELVRQKLAPTICQRLASNEGELHVLTLDPALERSMGEGLGRTPERNRLVLEPKLTEQVIKRLSSNVEKMINENMFPVLLTAPELRRHVYALTERLLPHLAVLSLSEVPSHIKLRSFATVTI